MLLAGRGFGKTRTGVEWVRQKKETTSRIALIAPTAGDARDIMVEGESGILNCSPPWDRPTYEPSKRKLTWSNGAVALLYSAEEPDRLRGAQQGAGWLDELASWKYLEDTYSNYQFGLRLGDLTQTVITTTPRPLKILKKLIGKADKSVALTTGSTYENMDNLAQTFREQILEYEGTRLGRQELHAEILDDNPYALWKHEWIEDARIPCRPELKRIVVAVDPPITSGENADECGIVVYGVDGNGHGYVLDDRSCQGMSPDGWASEAVKAYNQYEADRIVAEVNQGGEMVESVIRKVSSSVSYKSVHATRGKVVRAEPIAALYERGKIHHVGHFQKLEGQMCEFSTDFDKKKMGYSPDRVDALVWAATDCHKPRREFFAI